MLQGEGAAASALLGVSACPAAITWTMSAFRSLLVAWGLVAAAAALSCGPCDRTQCPAQDCPLDERHRDPCDCCDVCLRRSRDPCGGPQNLHGTCAPGLVCVVAESADHGVCLESSRTCPNLETYSGCNLLSGQCLCGTIRACVSPNFQFPNREACTADPEATETGHSNVASELELCNEIMCPTPPTPESMMCPNHTAPMPVYNGYCCPVRWVCECVPTACSPEPPPTCSDSHSLAVHQGNASAGHCCYEYRCDPIENHSNASGDNCNSVECPVDDTICPPDSYKLPAKQVAEQCCPVPQGCTCMTHPCLPPDCPVGTFPSVVHPAVGKPGKCCPTYKCIKDLQAPSCWFNDQEYKNGITWAVDSCNSCTCRNGVAFCESVRCNVTSYCGRMATPPGQCCPVCIGCISSNGMKFYENNKTWHEDDCTTCTCVNGEAQCYAEMCQIPCNRPVKVPGQCCPRCEDSAKPTEMTTHCQLKNCSLRCLYGYRKNHLGCPICECAEPNKGSVCPPLTGCYKECSHGFKLDVNGCPACKCLRCKKPKDCPKKCPFGFQNNSNDCPICKCREYSDIEAKTISTPFPDLSTASLPDITTQKSTGLDNLSCVAEETRHRYDNNEMWSDGCRRCLCVGGVEMCTLITCPVPLCSHPVIFPGDCCPSCIENTRHPSLLNVSVCSTIDGHYRVEGESWAMDACTHCICHGGVVMCSSPMCPPTPCHNPVRRPGDCCAKCPELAGNTTAVSHTLPCNDGTADYQGGEMWRIGVCQSCICYHGEIRCYPDLCPPLRCGHPVLKKNQCCPVCIDYDNLSHCFHHGILYTNGEAWSVSECMQCTCNNGITLCKEKVCRLYCDKPIPVQGQCCPVCSEEHIYNNNYYLLTALLIVACIIVVFLLVLVLVLLIRLHYLHHGVICNNWIPQPLKQGLPKNQDRPLSLAQPEAVYSPLYPDRIVRSEGKIELGKLYRTS